MLFITTMTTEFVSNTTVALVLFPLVHAFALSLQLNPLVCFLAVGLASTNAFMTPLGTPVNALLFGGVKNVSLAMMVASGFLLNFISSLWMAAALEYWVPHYYGL
ncbi:anion permease [candidate division KSB1 bacterium]|nr:anion permease [candidate division KSB1 bacterium]